MMRLTSRSSRLGALAITMVVSAAVLPAQAAFDDQAAATRTYALKALDFYRAKGLDGTKASFLTPKTWLLGPDQWNLHVTGLSNDQMVWADSGFPEVVGQSYRDVEDLDGVALGKSVWDGLARSPEGASIQLRFSNPVTKAVAHTEGYCVQADSSNVICAWSQTN